MNTRHITFVIGIIAIIVLSSGFAAANINQNDLIAHATWSKTDLPQGSSVIVTITLQSESDQQIQVYFFGVHFDWMAADTFAGQNLQSAPVTIPSGGSYQFTPSIINIPQGTSLGSHTYTIGIDGDDSDGQAFSWTSTEASIQVVASSTTPTSGGNSNPGEQNSDWAIGIAIIAATAVIMIVIILIVLRRKRSAQTTTQTTEPETNESEPQKPEE